MLIFWSAPRLWTLANSVFFSVCRGLIIDCRPISFEPGHNSGSGVSCGLRSWPCLESTFFLVTKKNRLWGQGSWLDVLGTNKSLPFKFFLLQTNLPVFKVKESTVRRRYSDFKWLRSELERDSKVLTKFLTVLTVTL